ncbi:hypothetical protein [Neptuniibacter sp.]|uniref:hypothetical protein n=1 Tax=Neptuniibacter sp. TaxID=1962643 RepID=UPI002611FF5B|nr:hypothetical protein [Neptuniibacter sp.]MCP4597058.1 hypothetical protein [Neptuniibacter sp.]
MGEYQEPVIVLGPPRSGTSAVARVLHENMGIFMGFDLKKSIDITPDGSYESEEIHRINSLLIEAHCNHTYWGEGLVAYTKRMYELKSPWGLKDPKFAHPIVLGPLVTYFAAPVFVRCHRTREQTVKSCTAAFGTKKSQGESMYHFRNTSMDKILPNNMTIFMDMSERATDTEIEERIKAGGDSVVAWDVG